MFICKKCNKKEVLQHPELILEPICFSCSVKELDSLDAMIKAPKDEEQEDYSALHNWLKTAKIKKKKKGKNNVK